MQSKKKEIAMPRVKNKIENLEIRDTIALASIIKTLPKKLVEEALAENAPEHKSRNRTLPSTFVVYFLIFLCIYRKFATDEVLRKLFEGLDTISPIKPLLTASDAAISKARQRVGVKPLKKLFQLFCKPMCDKEKNKDAFYQGLRKCAIDGSEIYLQYTDDIVKEFPVKENDKKNPQPCPKLMFNGIIEVGSHAYIDMEVGNSLQTEQDFADELIDRIGKGKLLIGDRLYTSVLNIQRVKDQGSEVLFRASSNLTLTPTKRLHDGSYLAYIVASKRKHSHGAKYRTEEHPYKKVLVRVIPYIIKNTEGIELEKGRLVTTLLDPDKYPSIDFINIYTERWTEEKGYDELKVHLYNGAQDNLRSKKPELVLQEFWALIITHYIIRKIMYEASELAGKIPRKMSFVGVKNVIKRKTTTKLFSP